MPFRHKLSFSAFLDVLLLASLEDYKGVSHLSKMETLSRALKTFSDLLLDGNKTKKFPIWGHKVQADVKLPTKAHLFSF